MQCSYWNQYRLPTSRVITCSRITFSAFEKHPFHLVAFQEFFHHGPKAYLPRRRLKMNYMSQKNSKIITLITVPIYFRMPEHSRCIQVVFSYPASLITDITIEMVTASICGIILLCYTRIFDHACKQTNKLPQDQRAGLQEQAMPLWEGNKHKPLALKWYQAQGISPSQSSLPLSVFSQSPSQYFPYITSSLL